jgi:hypothetical protein
MSTGLSGSVGGETGVFAMAVAVGCEALDGVLVGELLSLAARSDRDHMCGAAVRAG